MTQDELNRLNPGDIVRGKSSKELYVVTGNYGGRVTAVKTADITNAIEWELVAKSKSSGEPKPSTKKSFGEISGIPFGELTGGQVIDVMKQLGFDARRDA